MEGADRDPEFLHRREQVFAPVLGIIERGQSAGQIRSDISAQWAVTALMSLLAAAVGQDKNVEDFDIADRVFDTVVFGIQESTHQEN